LPLHDPLLDGETRQAELQLFDLVEAERDRRSPPASGSTTRPKTTSSSDGISRGGVRLVTFAPILNIASFSWRDCSISLLRISADGTGAPWRSKFRARDDPARRAPHDFGFLQSSAFALSRRPRICRLGDVRRTRSSARAPASSQRPVSKRRDLVVSIFTGSMRPQPGRRARRRTVQTAELARRGRAVRLESASAAGDPRSRSSHPGDVGGASPRECDRRGRVPGDFRVRSSQRQRTFSESDRIERRVLHGEPGSGRGIVDWDGFAAQPAVRENDIRGGI